MHRYNDKRIGTAWLTSAVLGLALLTAGPLLAQNQGLVLAGSVTGAPGSTVSLPLTVVLNPGVHIDTFGVTVSLVPVDSAPAPSAGKLAFTPSDGISAPSLTAASTGDIVIAWLGNLSATDPKHAISGIVRLGTVSATIPAGAPNGAAYNVQIARVEGDVSGVNGSIAPVPLTSVSSAIGPVSTAIPLPPVIEPRGVLNAASLSVITPANPGSIASLFGQNLAAAAELGTAVPPATALGGTQLLLNGIPAPLFYVSAGQINFQIPAELTGTTAQAVVITNGVRSLTASVPLVRDSPGIFTASASGSGQGAVLNQDYSINSAQNPAAAGSGIMIYATGLGPTNPPVSTGQGGGTSPPSVTVDQPTVLINGVAAQVLYSGLAPGFPGEYQVNAVIPAGTPPGAAVPLQIQIGGQSSNTATIAVQ